MAYIVQSNSRLQYPGELSSAEYIVINDGVAQPSTTFTAGVGATQFTTADNTGFFPMEIIQLPGGTAGALDWYQIRTCGVPIGVDNTIRVDTRPNKTLVTAVTAASASPYFKVPVRTMPSLVTLTNLASGTTWKWQRGMEQNTALVLSPAGVLANGGIVCLPNSINFNPSLLGINQSMAVTVQFAAA